MSHGSLSVSEVSKSSSLLGKANTSSPQESESEGFIDILKSAFSSDSPKGEEAGDAKITSDADGKVSKSGAEGDESAENISTESISTESVKGKASDGSDVEAEAADIEGSVSKSSGKVDGEESADSLLNQDTSKAVADKASAANVDETMNEGNKLLERLDESNKVLAVNAQPSTEGKGLPPEAAAVAGLAAASQTKTATDASVVTKADGSSKAIAVDKPINIDKTQSDAAKLSVIAAGAVVVGQVDSESVPVEGATTKMASVESDVDVSLDEKSAAILAAGTIGVASEASKSGKVADTVSSEQIKWGTPSSTTQSVSEAEVQAAAALQGDGVDVTQTSIAAGVTGAVVSAADGEPKVKGVTATQNMQASGFEGQPLVAVEDEVSVTYGEPMWASSNGELATAEGSKKGIEASTAAKVATSAALVAQLHNPTATQLPTDKAAASLASSGALSQDIAMQSAQAQSLAAANAVSSPLAATEQAKVISAAAASALVLGDSKGQSTKPGNGIDDKSDLAHQLAGVAGQQGLTTAQARGLEAQTVNAAQQPPLQLTRDAAGEQLAERVQMMLSKNLKNIDIRLDPPELGRMQIRMTMNNDVASVQFTVANHQTRDIVEQAMPRLREMLAQQGLQLADTSVQQQNAGQQQQSQYVAGQDGQQGRKNGDSDADGELGLDNPLEVNVDVTSNRDGISFYA